MPSSLVTRMRISLLRVPGAAHDEVVRCRPGTPVSSKESWVPDQRCTASGTRGLLLLDLVHAAHVWLERVRHRDGAVLVLIVLHHRDQRAADGDAGAVERMHVGRLAVLAPEARV